MYIYATPTATSNLQWYDNYSIKTGWSQLAGYIIFTSFSLNRGPRECLFSRETSKGSMLYTHSGEGRHSISNHLLVRVRITLSLHMLDQINWNHNIFSLMLDQLIRSGCQNSTIMAVTSCSEHVAVVRTHSHCTITARVWMLLTLHNCMTICTIVAYTFDYNT